MHLPYFQVTNIFPNKFLVDKYNQGVCFHFQNSFSVITLKQIYALWLETKQCQDLCPTIQLFNVFSKQDKKPTLRTVIESGPLRFTVFV